MVDTGRPRGHAGGDPGSAPRHRANMSLGRRTSAPGAPGRDGDGPDYVELFEQAPAGYLVLDATGGIETINHTGAAMLGWPARWLIGRAFSRWVVNDDKPLFQMHRRRLRDRHGRVSQKLRVKNRNGRPVRLRLESVRTPWPVSGREPGSRSIMIDVSSDEQSARKLRQLQSQLSYVIRMHTADELATSLAHELNQPLGTIVLNCDAALRLLNSGGSADYEFAESLAQAREAASFASAVIKHLRGFLRHDNECHTVRSLAVLLRDVVPLVDADARDHDIALVLEIASSLPQVRVDAVQIEQVLLNLVHNSIEAIAGDRQGAERITIRAIRRDAHTTQISVIDSGPGFTAGTTRDPFTAFYSTKPGGMGMGLSISRTIISDHGGELWANSPAAGGAGLHFTLPVAEETEDEP